MDKHALAPVYSYLGEEDQHHIIKQVHSQVKTSVETLDEVRKELAAKKNIEWYSIKSRNYGMLHNYSTVIGTEKSMWVPLSMGDEE